MTKPAVANRSGVNFLDGVHIWRRLALLGRLAALVGPGHPDVIRVPREVDAAAGDGGPDLHQGQVAEVVGEGEVGQRAVGHAGAGRGGEDAARLRSELVGGGIEAPARGAELTPFRPAAPAADHGGEDVEVPRALVHVGPGAEGAVDGGVGHGRCRHVVAVRGHVGVDVEDAQVRRGRGGEGNGRGGGVGPAGGPEELVVGVAERDERVVVGRVGGEVGEVVEVDGEEAGISWVADVAGGGCGGGRSGGSAVR